MGPRWRSMNWIRGGVLGSAIRVSGVYQAGIAGTTAQRISVSRWLCVESALVNLGGLLLRVAFLLGGLQGTGDHGLLAADVLVRDEVLARVLAGRQLVHHVQHQTLEQLAQGAGAGLLLDGPPGDGPQRVARE